MDDATAASSSPSEATTDRRAGAAAERPLSSRNLAVLAAVLAITVVVLWPTLGNGFTGWDDQVYVTGNQLIRDLSWQGVGTIFTTPVAGNFHPLTMLSLALDHAFGGLEPLPYHVTNLVLHLAVTALVFFFALAVGSGRRLLASLTALLFGIHPMHVESVAWVSARKDLLYAVFFLGALLAYVALRRRPRRSLLVVLWLCFVLSLLAKPAAVVLPIGLLLVDLLLGRRLDRRAVVEKLPMLGVAIAFGALTIYTQASAGALAMVEVAPLRRLLFACYALVRYLVSAIAPLGLSAFHPYPPATAPLAAVYYLAPLGVAVVAAAVYLARRNRVVVFGALFFVATIVLVLQLVSVGRAIAAERYTYLPYLGLFLVAAYGLDRLVARVRERRRWLAVAAVVVVAAWATTLGAVSYRRCAVWHDGLSLLDDAVGAYPHSGIVRAIRASIHEDQGEIADAITDLERATELEPTLEEPLYNLGVLKLRSGNQEQAVELFSRVLALDPEAYGAIYNRGIAYRDLNRFGEATADFTRAIEVAPDRPEPFVWRGWLRASSDPEAAIADFDAALAIDPSFTLALYDRALVLLQQERLTEALADLDRALESSPSYLNARVMRSKLRRRLGDLDGALDDALKARRAGAKVPEAYLRSLRR